MILPLFSIFFIVASTNIYYPETYEIYCYRCNSCNFANREDILNGLEVSHHDDIDYDSWLNFKENGIKYVFARTSYGSKKSDSTFIKKWDDLRKVGIVKGPFHFYLNNQLAKDQFETFTKILPNISDSDLPPVLDFEDKDYVPKSKEDKIKLVKQLKTWLESVKQHYKRIPIIYTREEYWRTTLELNNDDIEYFSQFPLWLAGYPGDSNYYENPPIPMPWVSKYKDYKNLFWQYCGDSGYVKGMKYKSLDLDLFYGTEVDLQNFIKSTIIQ